MPCPTITSSSRFSQESLTINSHKSCAPGHVPFSPNAVEAEVADFLGQHADLKTADGHRRVVRHGHLPEREVMTGIGPVAVRQPRVRVREALRLPTF
ncbi:hypothetical protein ABIA43_002038 [Bradyrhizobium sp. USDA 328]